MRVRDSRPPFAGLANLSEAQLHRLPTPCYLLDEAQLCRNGEILLGVQQRTGCRILLAQKAFSNFNVYPVLAPYLAGTEASGLYESRLGREELPEKENHVFCAAYRTDEFEELLQYADHIVFNSPSQLAKFGPAAKAAGKSIGLRINPECSTQEGHEIYDPCAPGSRLGTTRAQWDAAVAAHPELPALLDGLHFHTLCEQSAEDLADTLEAVEQYFGSILSRPEITWLNMGGGHWITKPGYNRELLANLVRGIRSRYGVDVWLEPGEAVAIHSGVLRCRVLDVFSSEGVEHAILDVSASAHMPDTLEMPYRPDVFQILKDPSLRSGQQPAVVMEGESYAVAGEPGEGPFAYRLGAPTCLAGDRLGDYSFAESLSPGDELVFDDMAHYTMVKTTFFNGVRHPDIAVQKHDGSVETVRRFSYEDFEARLG